MLFRTDVAFKGDLYISVPFLQRLCVEARVGNVTCSRKVCSLMQIIMYASSLTLRIITFLYVLGICIDVLNSSLV